MERRSRFSTESSGSVPGRGIWAGWEVWGVPGALWSFQVPVSDICWKWGSPVFAHWLFSVLFTLSSSSQHCLRNAWEGKWAERELKISFAQVRAKLWIIKPLKMKYFSLWWKEAQGRCFNGCFSSENQIFLNCCPHWGKHPWVVLAFSAWRCSEVYPSTESAFSDLWRLLLSSFHY